ncbi:MAG: 2OG-Fe(II) oxygenase [Armatimonadetes bacterium]|nr:2OG-Fe(II) oxygenase [Armatimonadota bacterium]
MIIGQTTTASSGATRIDSLEGILQNRRWLYRSEPYGHYTAANVFTAEFYGEVARQYMELLGRGLSESPQEGRFSRLNGNYDAYLMRFEPGQEGPLSLFTSRAWHDMVAGLFQIDATGDVDGALHHHAIGGRNGRIHNDLNPGWFISQPPHGGVNVTDPKICSYTSGKTAPGFTSRETARAVAVLFYLCNDGWRPGDGGETGLYMNEDDPIESPIGVVPPINNSLLAFECTPYSFHTFLSNRRLARNCIVMWVHRTKEETISRWGWNKVVPW